MPAATSVCSCQWTISVDQCAAGQPQEHVFERAAPHENGDRHDTTGVDAVDAGLAVVGVEQYSVGQHFDAFGEPGQLVGSYLVLVEWKAQLHDVTAGVLLDEVARRTLSRD